MKFLLVRPKEMPGNRPVREMTYTVQAKTNFVDPVTHQPLATGPGGNQRRIAAIFNGLPPSFDSELTAKAEGWTDDERKRVEVHLLTHKDYGRGIYLFPGETLPEEHQGIAEETQAPDVVAAVTNDGTCQFLVSQFPPEFCGDDALPGTELCQRHFNEVKTAEVAEEKAKAPKRRTKQPEAVSS